MVHHIMSCITSLLPVGSGSTATTTTDSWVHIHIQVYRCATATPPLISGTGYWYKLQLADGQELGLEQKTIDETRAWVKSVPAGQGLLVQYRQVFLTSSLFHEVRHG